MIEGMRRSWQVDALHRCDAIVQRTATGSLELVVHWRPALPRRMSDAQHSSYLTGRAAALRAVQRELGMKLVLKAQIE